MNNAEHKTQSKEITTLIIHLEKNMISENGTVIQPKTTLTFTKVSFKMRYLLALRKKLNVTVSSKLLSRF